MTTRLNIFDLSCGKPREVLRHDGIIEAPNWAPDGSYLLINHEGRLYRVPLDDPQMQVVDTGFATQCNNDHGISPDGTTYAISDSVETGKSCIYTLPSAGGTPTRITKDVPSYWHGWSPDGARLTYTALRDGVFDIFTCPVAGGAETKLTCDFDHTDGPDYTPDGDWIWFNGMRAGSMELWRVRFDGSDLEQMTQDDQVNWFPHPSPDGRNVLFISYAKDGVSAPHDHPRDREVSLRLMPAKGGTPAVLLDIFGGQGTINVPCWSPDGTQFAYVDVLNDA